MAYLRGAIVMATLFCAHAALAEGDVKAGRQVALRCQACHGLDGVSRLAEAPNLSGQVEPYLVKSLTEFRAGVRKNEMMAAMSAALSDQDIENVAAYYAAFNVTVAKR